MYRKNRIKIIIGFIIAIITDDGVYQFDLESGYYGDQNEKNFRPRMNKGEEYAQKLR